MLLDKKISQKIAIFKGKYTFGLYQLIFGTYLNVLQCVGLHFLSLVSFIPYVSFIKNSKIGPPCRLFHTWLLFFFSFWVLCVFYSIRVVYSGLKSTDLANLTLCQDFFCQKSTQHRMHLAQEKTAFFTRPLRPLFGLWLQRPCNKSFRVVNKLPACKVWTKLVNKQQRYGIFNFSRLFGL